MKYPPYTEQDERTIYRNAAKVLIGFILIKTALNLTIALAAKAIREKS